MTIAIVVFNDGEDILLRPHAETIGGAVTILTPGDDVSPYTHILCAAHNASRDYLAQLGAKLNAQPITDIVSIENENTFTRPIYAGSALATVQSLDDKKLLSVRTGRASDTATDLRHARVVVSGGRSLGSKENFGLLYQLAKPLNAAVGSTRAAVDAGYIGNETQIGQTGKTVAPDLYIAFGVSGALQHVGGIRDAKTVIAVNSDANAPIFKHATYGFVGDLFAVLPELTKKLSA